MGACASVSSTNADGPRPQPTSPTHPPPQQQQAVRPAGAGNANTRVSGLRPKQQGGNKRSLLVGINYVNSDAELRGCWNDVETMKRFLTKQGFPENAGSMRVLLDKPGQPASTQPNKQNILNAMKWLVQGATAGDDLFFHYSGHGGKERDDNMDEKDGWDETLIPVDYKDNGQIRDDVVFNTLVKDLPAGVRLTVLLDCCHSGTALDLPYVFVANKNNCANWMVQLPLMALSMSWDRKSAAGIIGNLATLAVAGAIMYAESEADKKSGKKEGWNAENFSRSAADVIMISGCRDDQTSADVGNTGKFKIPKEAGPGGAGGACTNALIEQLSKRQGQTYMELLDGMRRILMTHNFTQVPQLSSSKQIDLGARFDLFDDLSPQQWQGISVWGGAVTVTPNAHTNTNTHTGGAAPAPAPAKPQTNTPVINIATGNATHTQTPAAPARPPAQPAATTHTTGGGAAGGAGGPAKPIINVGR